MRSPLGTTQRPVVPRGLVLCPDLCPGLSSWAISFRPAGLFCDQRIFPQPVKPRVLGWVLAQLTLAAARQSCPDTKPWSSLLCRSTPTSFCEISFSRILTNKINPTESTTDLIWTGILPYSPFGRRLHYLERNSRAQSR